MTAREPASCVHCHFRQEGLCALPGDRPCPTFRASTKAGLRPPRQPVLIARPLQQASSLALTAS